MKYFFIILFFFISSNAFTKDLFSHSDNFAFKKQSGTHALLIYQSDKINFEKYGNGFGPDRKHIAWSISKSISSAVLGSLAAQSKINIQQSICHYLKDEFAQSHCALTPHDFLSWSSGLQWIEAYENESKDPTLSSVAQLLYGDGRENSTEFILSHPRKQTTNPKERWSYSTGDSTIVMALAQSALATSNLMNKAPHSFLFETLGIKDIFFQTDGSGSYLGGSGVFISPKDLIRLGELYLNKGVYKGQKVFDASWYDYTLTSDFADNDLKQTSYYPLRSWWGLSPKLRATLNLKREVLIARGHWGQFLIILPELKLIVVRMGFNQSSSFDAIRLIEAVLLDLGHLKKPVSEIANFKNYFISSKIEKKEYESPITTLGLNYRANHACQCLFTMGFGEERCQQISDITPKVFKINIDRKSKSVEAYIPQSGLTPVRYQFNPEARGCQAEK